MTNDVTATLPPRMRRLVDHFREHGESGPDFHCRECGWIGNTDDAHRIIEHEQGDDNITEQVETLACPACCNDSSSRSLTNAGIELESLDDDDYFVRALDDYSEEVTTRGLCRLLADILASGEAV